ncbi:MAG: HEPN domain-containing protein [Bacteroidia bacterium]|nr:HEPN domain-containing protein [Bacteroidia bacterium]
MQSFRSELENIKYPTKVVEKDIIELERKIFEFKKGQIHEEKFRSLRLARGVYGQRQKGVQMIRIKIPYGKVNTRQLFRLADISDEYSNGNLHITTRQDVQLHFVSLERTPELWYKLEQDQLTLREACGNTVRNITASAEAGIDPNEPFDVSPYADALFRYFLRKPFCQEMGRKVKIAFSSSDDDTAYTYIHDFGFIPKLKDGKKGFKVLVGGGLGAQPFHAQTAFEFLETNRIIPFVEAALRVFDRHGERTNRHKARLKYLIAKIGLNEFLKLTEEEKNSLNSSTVEIEEFPYEPTTQIKNLPDRLPELPQEYHEWLSTNVIRQKQENYYGVYLKIRKGNISSHTIRDLCKIIAKWGNEEEIRLTIGQGILLRFIPKEHLPFLYSDLKTIGLADIGANSVADITSCPGTDTCNLAIANSTQLAVELEKIILHDFRELINNRDIKIKISGCMNSCGQHGLAHIGFHGSSIKSGDVVIPAMQVLMGGQNAGEGKGFFAEKIIKLPTKRIPLALKLILSDYENNASPETYFHDYYKSKGKDYFYRLLKPLSGTEEIKENELLDWGADEKFKPEIGVGECAGVVIDLVQTLLFEAEEKIEFARDAFQEGLYSDSIYHSYSSFIHAAKAILLEKEIHVNTHHSLIKEFDKHFSETFKIPGTENFEKTVLLIKQTPPGREFAGQYMELAKSFLKLCREYKNQVIATT